ncbi:hypothetical protein AAH978_12565 [Streptomyces sp. ZYX-F-203]
MAFGVVACAGQDGGSSEAKPPISESASSGSGSNVNAQEAAEEVLAELKGPQGLLLRVTSLERDAGGFVTVNGTLKNEGANGAVVPAGLSGNETEIVKNGRSLGGATLVDPTGKKRYYVLRDTEGRPLTTTGFATIKSGEGVPVFMQFPAPPSENAELTLHLPMFSSAGITIPG